MSPMFLDKATERTGCCSLTPEDVRDGKVAGLRLDPWLPLQEA